MEVIISLITIGMALLLVGVSAASRRIKQRDYEALRLEMRRTDDLLLAMSKTLLGDRGEIVKENVSEIFGVRNERASFSDWIDAAVPASGGLGITAKYQLLYERAIQEVRDQLEADTSELYQYYGRRASASSLAKELRKIEVREEEIGVRPWPVKKNPPVLH